MGVKSWGGLALAVALAWTGYVAIFIAPGRPPAPGVETTNWLAARSIALDADLRYTDEDGRRYRERFGASPSDLRTDRDGETLNAPPLASRAWAAAYRIGAERGPHALNWLLFASAILLATWILAPSFGSDAPAWVALFAFGSIAFDAVFRLLPELSALLAVVVAAALVWRPAGRARHLSPAPAPDGDPPKLPDQIYSGDAFGSAARSALWRWPLAGLALGAAALRSPTYLLLALPMAMDLPRRRRGLGGALMALGLALPIAFVGAVSGSTWEPPSAIFTPALLGWNALYLLVGRSAGVLVYFLPLLAILGFSRRLSGDSEGRRLLPFAVLAAAFLQLLLYPFDWTGDRSTLGNPWFLPLYAALWFAIDGRATRRSIPLVALAALPALLPFWVSPAARDPRPPASVRAILETAVSALPFETTLREIPGAQVVRRSGVRLRSLDPSIGGAGGQFLWQGSRSATLIVESDRSLESIRLELSENAPSQVGVGGGVAGDTIFRPSGGVALDVALSGPARRHPLWWSREAVSIYFVRLAIPEVPPAPIRVDLAAAKPSAADVEAP